jgi:hypothetical protein
MKLPKDWHGVTLGQFQQLQKLTEPSFENNVITLSILSGKTIEQIEELPLNTIQDAIASLSWMNELPIYKGVNQFRHGNNVYRFVANKHDLAAHQWITAQDLFSGGNWVDNLHKIMAALAVRHRLIMPKRFNITAAEFEDTANLFRDKMPCTIAYGYALFFSAYFPKSLEVTRAYLEAEAKRLMQMKGSKTE